MRRWILKRLKGVPYEDHLRLHQAYLELVTEIELTIEKHNLQGAWQQMKEERSAARMH